MKAAPVDRAVASAAYSFLRFGGAAVAPWLAGVLGEQVNVHLPYWVGAAAVLAAAGVDFGQPAEVGQRLEAQLVLSAAEVEAHHEDDRPAQQRGETEGTVRKPGRLAEEVEPVHA